MPPKEPITVPWQCGFSSGGKKEEYAKTRTEGREVSYGKIGLTTVSGTQVLLSGMSLVLKIELICLFNCILPLPGLWKLISLTSCNKPVV